MEQAVHQEHDVAYQGYNEGKGIWGFGRSPDLARWVSHLADCDGRPHSQSSQRRSTNRCNQSELELEPVGVSPSGRSTAGGSGVAKASLMGNFSSPQLRPSTAVGPGFHREAIAVGRRPNAGNQR